jgi:hypothetical protein
MSSQRRSLAAVAASFTLLSGIMIAGCQQDGPAGPSVTDIRLARGGGGGKGPKVDSADPPSAPQDTQLDIRVLGSGFDNGSVVTFTIDGTSQPKVVTERTRFVSKRELVAEVTIDLEAPIDLYDVEVLTLAGKKGTGADLFSVTKKELLYSVEVTELGTLPGAKRVIAMAIAGTHIVGYSSVGPWHMTTLDGDSPALLKCDGVGTAGCDRASPDVNSDGLIVSAVTKESDGLDQAAYWTSAGSTNIDLPIPSGSVVSGAKGVSATGYVAGKAILGEILPENQQALLWKIDAAGMVTAPRNLHVETFYALGAWSAAHDVNDFGQVVGSVEGFGAFFWDDGETVALPGEGDVSPAAINSSLDNVRVAGSFQNLPGSPSARGVVWTVQDGAVTVTDDLPPLIGHEEFWSGRDINDAGDVVGTGQKLNSGTPGRESLVHALLWTRDETGAYTVVDLGLGRAQAIENVSLQGSGTTRIVGSIETKKGGARPVMWTVRKLN